MKFKQYRRKNISEMRSYIDGEILDENVSISEVDKKMVVRKQEI